MEFNFIKAIEWVGNWSAVYPNSIYRNINVFIRNIHIGNIILVKMPSLLMWYVHFQLLGSQLEKMTQCVKERLLAIFKASDSFMNSIFLIAKWGVASSCWNQIFARLISVNLSKNNQLYFDDNVYHEQKQLH